VAVQGVSRELVSEIADERKNTGVLIQQRNLDITAGILPFYALMRIRLMNWRLWLILTHRWMGIVLGLLLVIWTVSGIVLMYYGLPHLTAGERLARLPSLEAAAIRVSPAEAAAKAGGEPFRIRVSMLGGRPVYRINTGRVFGRWTLVYADTGEVFAGFNDESALTWLEGYVPEAAGNMSVDGYITAPDLYTHNPGLQTHMPMYRIALNDSSGTFYYVSERSGEAVMRTDRLGRVLGFLGYELHTLFFWRQERWWGSLLQSLSWLALVMAVLGLILGVVRFALKPRYMHRSVLSRTPYQGLMKWHHYAGLIFGLFALTWIFSGLVSMSVIPGIVETFYTQGQIAVGARSVQGEGPRLDLEALTAENLRAAAAAISREIPISELELISFSGVPYYMAYRVPTPAEQRDWQSRSAFDFISPTLDHEHRLISAVNPTAGTFERFSADAMLSAARLAMPEADVVSATWLEEFDDYYYDRHTSFDLGLPQAVKTLPVLRVEFDDPLGTWLYLTPSHGQVLKFESRDRANRWGYYGLHALDFGFLFERRPLWDVVVLILMIGVGIVSTTTLWPMMKRLSRHARRICAPLPGRRS
jgi:hypothetical protein